jgi:hypothetical protein
MAVHHFKYAVLAFDQCRTGFHPIAAIIISDRAELMNRCAVDVSAQHRVHGKFFGVLHNRCLKLPDKTDRIFYALLHVCAQRPVAEPETAPEKIDERIEREQKLVTKIACEREPLHILHHRVQLVAVDNKDALSIRRSMNRMFLDRDVSESAVVIGEHLVVITRDINNAGAFARLAQNFLDDVVVLLWPVAPAAQLPDIDEIADDVKRFKLIIAQKIQERARVTPTRAQVNIRDPRSTDALFGIQLRARRLKRKARRRNIGRYVDVA